MTGRKTNMTQLSLLKATSCFCFDCLGSTRPETKDNALLGPAVIAVALIRTRPGTLQTVYK